MSNGIEIKKFIKKVHKMKRNINDSAYFDLLVTDTLCFSRNRMFGNMMGRDTVKSAMMEMSMVSGYYATKSA
jgi:glycerol-3-phosphate dehydrogenase (NAD(P)+)